MRYTSVPVSVCVLVNVIERQAKVNTFRKHDVGKALLFHLFSHSTLLLLGLFETSFFTFLLLLFVRLVFFSTSFQLLYLLRNVSLILSDGRYYNVV